MRILTHAEKDQREFAAQQPVHLGALPLEQLAGKYAPMPSDDLKAHDRQWAESVHGGTDRPRGSGD